MPRKKATPTKPATSADSAYLKRLALDPALQKAEKRIKATTDSPEFRAAWEQAHQGFLYTLEMGEADDIYTAIERLAGELGVDPGPLTARELVYRAEGKRRSQQRPAEYWKEVLQEQSTTPKPGDDFGSTIEAMQGSKRRTLMKCLWADGNRPSLKKTDAIKAVYQSANGNEDKFFDLVKEANNWLAKLPSKEHRFEIKRQGERIQLFNQVQDFRGEK